jgi:hypothetical protein
MRRNVRYRKSTLYECPRLATLSGGESAVHMTGGLAKNSFLRDGWPVARTVGRWQDAAMLRPFPFVMPPPAR